MDAKSYVEMRVKATGKNNLKTVDILPGGKRRGAKTGPTGERPGSHPAADESDKAVFIS
jgi:hypothetical protein